MNSLAVRVNGIGAAGAEKLQKRLARVETVYW